MAVFPTAAAERLREYNSNAYDPATNPYGMALGGHRQNFPLATADVAIVGEFVQAAAAEADASATAAATSAGAAVDARALSQRWAANPEDVAVQAGLFSALHYAAKAQASAAAAATFDPANFYTRAETDQLDAGVLATIRDGVAAGYNTLKKLYDLLILHTSRTNNPHGVTASQVGLGSVNNTSDANKPVSTATQAALDGKVNAGQGITGLERSTAHGWDQLLTRMSDGTTRRAVSDISGNRIAVHYNASLTSPVIRVDATDFTMATRAYAETLVAGRLAGVRAVDIGWTRPVANAGDFLPASNGDFASGFQMGANGFVGVFWRRTQMFINGAWQNIYAA